MVAVFRLVVIVVAVVVAVVANCFHHKCMYSVDQWRHEPVAVVKASALQAAADFTGRCTHLLISAILLLQHLSNCARRAMDTKSFLYDYMLRRDLQVGFPDHMKNAFSPCHHGCGECCPPDIGVHILPRWIGSTDGFK